MNLQTIRNLEDALTALGAGKNVTVDMTKERFETAATLWFSKIYFQFYFRGYKRRFVVATPGGFIITVIEKK